MSGILSWIIFLPIVGMFVVMFTPRNLDRLIRWIGVIVTGLVLLLSLQVLAKFNLGEVTTPFCNCFRISRVLV